MSAFLKELRFPITALFVLVVATGVVLVQRQKLTKATADVEVLAIAKLLADLPANAVKFEGSTKPLDKPETQDEQNEEGDLQDLFVKVFDVFSQDGAIEVMGQFKRPCRGGCKYKILMLGGGWLVFSAESEEDPFFQNLLRYQKQTQEEWDKLHPPQQTRREPQHPLDRRLYYIGVVVDKAASSVVSRVPKIVFTNVEIEADKVDWTVTHAVPGRVRVYYPDKSSQGWTGPSSTVDLSASALEHARVFGFTSKDPESAYLELRATFERQEVELPFLSVKVNADSFLAYAFLLSLGLSAWASFLFRALRRMAPQDVDEPWILVEPFRELRLVSGWDRPLAIFEVALFSLFHLAAISAPLAIAGLMFATRSSSDRWLALAGVLMGMLLSGSMTAKYLGIVRCAWRSRGTSNSKPES